MAEEASQRLIQSLIDRVHDIAQIGDCKKLTRKDCFNLTRRVKLLAPLFEELREMKQPLSEGNMSALELLNNALQAAMDLLRQCYEGSKLYLVLERDGVASRFHSLTTQLGHALDFLPYTQLGLSDEVHEQVELVHAQLKRAKSRMDTPDLELYVDAMVILSWRDEKESDEVLLQRFAKKAQLRTKSELKQECRALQNLIMDKDGKYDEHIEQISSVLCKLKAVAVRDSEDAGNDRISTGTGPNSPNIPDDFRCPISLELMEDPVIVATGQTYDRACIQKWLDAGHKTCPKTQQVLPHLVLTPNYVLRSLIGQWCETRGIEISKKSGSSRSSRGGETYPQVSPGDRAAVNDLLQKLSGGRLDVQRAAAEELRLLAKRSADNRVCIAEAGAIPVLVDLLTVKDAGMQEHVVTALLNLSIRDHNKSLIVLSGGINRIVEVLQHGSIEARENAAATLFSLSVVDENKVTIGSSGAIPALIDLLRDGTVRGKKDAATALFNLCIFQGNKRRAVRAGAIPPLRQLLVDPSAGMVDEALAVIAILATHLEGRVAIGSTSPVPVLVDLIKSGSPRNKENAAAVLLALSTTDPAHLADARKHGAYVPLAGLARSGTARARRKATSLLEYMNAQDE
ncbi:hypothetical protein O6H91_10G018700 [Diphasiastrum complanatum]|uniref:Uncharacterized protein n=1 Tax=Diphasiastrum complanatum TaxID=34168 RepID=A0ACC2CF41_DIPCM|nr:hypothetical protein O6H91_Y389000 [Diphasiastrum complanatum]KAJ7540504.1 hypothetical protein O6H91_10G018700 [Diphasiastrum complanatum]